MTELTVKIPEHQVPFFVALLERLQFVEIAQINGQSKDDFLRDFEASLQEAKLHLQGKIPLPKIETVIL